MIIQPTQHFCGRITLPGDKSISHRSLILSALAKGRSEITHLLNSADIFATLECLRQLGVQISSAGEKTIIDGCGLSGFTTNPVHLDCSNSGTTIRLLMGLLANRLGTAHLTGDTSLLKRPMNRVAAPLRQMGANLVLHNGNFPPITIEGKHLHGCDIHLSIASAQVKTALLLGAIHAEGRTRLSGALQSRDHTERLFKHYGINLSVTDKQIEIHGHQAPQPAAMTIPGDPSSAAFWIAAATLIPHSQLTLSHISLNPTRLGFIRALQKMGAHIQLEQLSQDPEPMGHIHVKHSELRGIQIGKNEIPSLIDEIPLLAILGTQAYGALEITGAEELRVKESDRIETLAMNLRAMGAEIETFHDGFRTFGPQPLKGAQIQTAQDHRIAMTFSIAGLIATQPTEILDSACVNVSYPEFYQTLHSLIQ